MLARTVLGVALLLPSSSLAGSVAQLFMTTTGSPNDSRYTGNPGGFYSGVALIDVFTAHSGVSECSGALIDPTHVLTAAHCVDPAEVGTITAIDVSFLGGAMYVAASSIMDPLFKKSNPGAGNDLGIVTLLSAAAGITPYSLWGGFGFGSTVDMAGYGIGGTGTTGFDPVNYDTSTFRHGENEFDATFNSFGSVAPGTSASNLYVYDFDDGSSACNTIQRNGVASSTGMGVDEATTAPGDSGGPSFIWGHLAGVHSFGIAAGAAGCATASTLSAYGSLGADGRVGEAANLAFIEAHSSAEVSSTTPEPGSVALVGMAAISYALSAFIGGHFHVLAKMKLAADERR